MFSLGHTGKGICICTEIESSGERRMKAGCLAMGHPHVSAWPEKLFAIAVSPDRKRVVSKPGDKTVKIWDVATGAEVMQLSLSLSFSLSISGCRSVGLSICLCLLLSFPLSLCHRCAASCDHLALNVVG